MYHENGQLRSRGFFKDAELDGSLEIYSEDGLLMVKDFYANGKRISE
jgi:antitoxin component YwqK of YwqJK toxin-antitoxin module